MISLPACLTGRLKMNNRLVKRFLFSFLIGLFFLPQAQLSAKKLPPVVQSGLAYVQNPTTTGGPYHLLYDYDYSSYGVGTTWWNNFYNVSQKNLIRIKIDRTKFNRYVYNTGTFNIKLTVSGEKFVPATAALSSFSENHDVTLSFDTSLLAKEKDEVVIVIDNVVKSQITINQIKFSNAAINVYGTAGNPDILLESAIEIERIYAKPTSSLSATAINIQTVNSLSSITYARNQWIQMSWGYSMPVLTSVEEFEIEYTHVQLKDPSSSQDIQGVTFPYSISNFPYNFRNNATKVTISTGTNFTLPNMFPYGALIFRVRPVWKSLQNPDLKIYGDWSFAESGNISTSPVSNVLNTLNPQPEKNWSMGLGFAEEGKKSIAVGYYDGTLRDREGISYIHSTGQYVVAQSIYDYLGRQALTASPSVALDNLGFDHHPKFNQNSSAAQYSYEDFDYNKSGSDEIEVDKMNPNSGASKYFSPNFKTTSQYSALDNSAKRMHEFMPDAEGYSFSQVEFTRDPTGRTLRQGNFGKTHQLKVFDKSTGSWINGKQTMTWDATPTQSELDVLFGNEVGYYNFYKKVMTQDPNGQLSVAYVDPYGRTIATALAGDPANTPNLEAIESSSHYLELYDQIQNTVLDKFAGKKETHFSFHVEESGYYKVYYNMTRQRFQLCDNSFCVDCAYDLYLSVQDPSDYNREKMPGGAPARIFLGQPVADTNACESNSVYFQTTPSEISIWLTPGEYILHKTLTVNTDIKNKLRDQFIYESKCVKPLSEFIEDEKKKMDLTCGEMDCDDCKTALTELYHEADSIRGWCGTHSTDSLEYAPYLAVKQEIREMKDICDEACNKSTCEVLYDAILLDMQPGGQYAEYTGEDADGNLTGLSGVTGASIFKDDPALWCSGTIYSSSIAAWKQPRNLASGHPYPYSYLTEDGEEFLIPASQLQPSQYSATVTISGVAYVQPHQLTSVSDFIEYYKDNLHWAKSLAVYHPEYCYYEKCQGIKASYDYDWKLMTTSSAWTAVKSGYFNPLNQSDLGTYNSTLIPDFSLYETGTIERDPIASLMSVTDLKNMLTSVTQCGTNTGRSIWNYYLTQKAVYEGSAFDTCVEDVLWPLLRALYLQEKNKFLKTYYHSQCQNGSTCRISTGSIKVPRFNLTDLGGMIAKAPESDWFKPSLMSDLDPCNETSFKDNVKEQIDAHCQSQCEDNADQWLNKFESCLLAKYTDETTRLAKKADLRAAFINLCKGGCDIDHPWGSQQVNPAKLSELDAYGNPVYPYSDIAAVLEGVLGADWFSQGVCDDLLVDFPGNYDHDYLAYEGAGMDTCACKKNKNVRKGIYARCDQSGHDSLKLDDCGCDKNKALRDARTAIIPIPDEKKCQNCITCKEMSEPLREFLLKYDVASYSDSAGMQQLLANYLNRKFGFNLMYGEYLSFTRECLDSFPKGNWYNPWKRIGREFLVAWQPLPDGGQAPQPLMKNRGLYESLAPESERQQQPLFVLAANNIAVKNANLPYPKFISPGANSFEASLNGIYASSAVATPPATTETEKVECQCKKILAAQKIADANGGTPETIYNDMYSTPGTPPTNTFSSIAGSFSFEDLKNKCCQLFNVGLTVPPGVECPANFEIGQPFGIPALQNLDVLTSNNSDNAVNQLSDPDCDQGEPLQCMKQLDTCGCNKLSDLKNQWMAHSVFGPSGTSPVTFTSFVQRTTGVTAANAQEMLELCEKLYAEALPKDPDGQPIGSTTPGTTGYWWRWSGVSNLNNRLRYDKSLKIPSEWSCSPDCNENPITECNDPSIGPCDLKNFLASYLRDHWPSSGPDFPGLGGYFGQLTDWMDYYDNYTGVLLSAEDLVIVNYLDALKQAFQDYYNSFRNCPQNPKVNYPLDYYLKQVLICIQPRGGNPYCITYPSCTQLGSLIKSKMSSVSWPGYTDPGYTNNGDYALDFEKWYYQYQINVQNSTATIGDGAWMSAIEDELNTQYNSCYPSKRYSLQSFLGLLYQCRPMPPKNNVQPPLCENCYEANRPWLNALQGFLNQVTQKPDPDYLTDYNFYLKTTSSAANFSNFYNSILYKDGTDETNLQWFLDPGYEGGRLTPGFRTTIKDNSGYKLKFSLDFPSDDKLYDLNNILSFENITPIKTEGCAKPAYFYVDVVYLVPKQLVNPQSNEYGLSNNYPENDPFKTECRIKVRMIGKIWESTNGGGVAKQAPCWPCKKLCNRPKVPVLYVNDNECEESELLTAQYNARENYRRYIEGRIAYFDSLYREKCFNTGEALNLWHKSRLYHFTLYYYDQAGNLIKTVPPAGVDIDNHSLTQTQRQQLANDRLAVAAAHRLSSSNPKAKIYHSLVTNYRYNSAGQLIWSNTPDGGESRLWYDKLGRVVLAQNSVQKTNGRFSYSKYDALGRAIEAGELEEGTFDWTNEDKIVDFEGSSASLSSNTISSSSSLFESVTCAKLGLYTSSDNQSVSYEQNTGTCALPIVGKATFSLKPGISYSLDYLASQVGTMASYGLTVKVVDGATTTVLSAYSTKSFGSYSQSVTLPSSASTNVNLVLEFSFSPGVGEKLLLDNFFIRHTETKLWQPDSRLASIQSFTDLMIERGDKYEVVNSFYNEIPSGHPLYSRINTAFGTGGQINLRNRVSTVTLTEKVPKNFGSTVLKDWGKTANSMAVYSNYDIHGNVIKAVKDIPALDHMGVAQYSSESDFDLISGKVNSTTWQKGKADQWIHKYEYNADIALQSVYTSRDGYIFENDAKYVFSLSGGAARTELGQLKVQGIDYLSNLLGWKKGVNGNSLVPENDMGRDGYVPAGGAPGNPNQYVARDAFSFTLSFFKEDYKNLNGQTVDANLTSSNAGSQYKDLYNDNIAMMTVALPKRGGTGGWITTAGTKRDITPEVLGNVYHHDQLQRLTKHYVFDNHASSASGNYLGGVWANTGQTGADKYYEDFSYDPNGNIKTLHRNAGTQVSGQWQMDNLTYRYEYNNLQINLQNSPAVFMTLSRLESNKLYHVNDAIGASSYSGDIDDEGTFYDNAPTAIPPRDIEVDNNYRYDALGNLILDKTEGIQSISWTTGGKIKKVTRTNQSSKPDLVFGYDIGGSKLWKLVIPKEQSGSNWQPKKQEYWDTTWYLGAGIYRMTHQRTSSTQLKKKWYIEEFNIVSGERLGVLKVDSFYKSRIMYCNTTTSYSGYLFTGSLTFTGGATDNAITGETTCIGTCSALSYGFYRGNKRYELRNHLGNVMVVISDRKGGRQNTTGTNCDYYLPYIVSISDYYAFGSAITERGWVAKGYQQRYGFNNQEKETELGDYYSFEYRIHDARLGKFLSVDPLETEYPYYSTYQFAGNMPILAIDIEGAEPLFKGKYPNQIAYERDWKSTFQSCTAATSQSYKQAWYWSAAQQKWTTTYNQGEGFKTKQQANNEATYLKMDDNMKSRREKPTETDQTMWELHKRIIKEDYKRAKSMEEPDIEKTNQAYLDNMFIPGDIPSPEDENYMNEIKELGPSPIRPSSPPFILNFIPVVGTIARYNYSVQLYESGRPKEAASVRPGVGSLIGEALVFIPGGKLVSSFTSKMLTGIGVNALPKLTPTMGGRLGNAATRSQIDNIATTLESRGYTITGGGGRTAEEFLKPLGGGRKGGSYLDITATHPNYPTLRINTVDVYKNGLPTLRELNNAARIRTQIAPGEHLLLIPKI